MRNFPEGEVGMAGLGPGGRQQGCAPLSQTQGVGEGSKTSESGMGRARGLWEGDLVPVPPNWMCHLTLVSSFTALHYK